MGCGEPAETPFETTFPVLAGLGYKRFRCVVSLVLASGLTSPGGMPTEENMLTKAPYVGMTVDVIVLSYCFTIFFSAIVIEDFVYIVLLVVGVISVAEILVTMMLINYGYDKSSCEEGRFDYVREDFPRLWRLMERGRRSSDESDTAKRTLTAVLMVSLVIVILASVVHLTVASLIRPEMGSEFQFEGAPYGLAFYALVILCMYNCHRRHGEGFPDRM